VCFIWGSTFVVVKSALSDASPLVFLAMRFVLGAVALAIVFRPLASKFARPAGAAGRWNPVIAGGVAAGFLLFTGYVLQTVGLLYTTPSKSAFLTGLSIVMVPAFSSVLKRKLPAGPEALGVLVAAVGMALLTLEGDSLTVGRGDLLTIGCAAAYAIHILLVGHWAPKTGFQSLALVQVATAAVLALGTFWWVEPPRLHWTPGLAVALIVTGLLATALAFSAQAWAQQYTTPTRTGLVFAMEPVFAWATSYVVAGELLSMRAALGAALILGGILLVELKPARGKPAEPA